jgi:hypothetical protein
MKRHFEVLPTFRNIHGFYSVPTKLLSPDVNGWCSLIFYFHNTIPKEANVYASPVSSSPHCKMLRFLLVLILVAISCSEKGPAKSKSTENAFYYWQTSLGAFNWTDSVYRSLNVAKVYYRFFDVDWSKDAQAPVPVSPLELSYTYNWSKQTGSVVPVVFITNETFKHLDREQSAGLAHSVYRKIMSQLNILLLSDSPHDEGYSTQDPYRIKSRNFDELRIRDSVYVAKMKTIREVQFDCDWTESTREKYFAFLKESKVLFKNQQVSSTVRLYQYKYPARVGIPPVERAMLMCYNAGDIRDFNTQNSIFDGDEIMSYLEGGKYPIPLDYALPVFEWAVLFREGEFRNILSSGILRENYQQYLSFENEQSAVVLEDFVYGNRWNSILIRKGDRIRVESPHMNEVRKTAAWLHEHKNNEKAILTLYHLNSDDLQEHSKAIAAIFDSF